MKQEGNAERSGLPGDSGTDVHVRVMTITMSGTISVFAARSPSFPRRRTMTPAAASISPKGKGAPVMSAISSFMPAIMAESTMSAFRSMTASTTKLSRPNMTALASSPTRAPTASRHAVSANIISPHTAGTSNEGDPPKNATIS